MHKEAFEFYRKARTLKPEHPSVIQNQIYFMRFWGFEKNATDRINPLQSVALRYILYCFRYW